MNNESYDFEDRKYVNPTLSRDEQLAFVDNLRSVQQNDMAKIAQDTHNLGSDLPSNEGGLTGSEGLWNAQYVDPKVNEMVASLKSAAQAQALNNILTNHQDQWQQRYNEAYRAAEKRKEALDYDKGGNNSGKNAGGEVDDDDPDWTDNTGGSKEVAKVEVEGGAPNANKTVQYETYTEGLFGITHSHAPFNVTYDEYGNIKKINAGRNGVYEGAKAQAYWDKMNAKFKVREVTDEKARNDNNQLLGE